MLVVLIFSSSLGGNARRKQDFNQVFCIMGKRIPFLTHRYRCSFMDRLFVGLMFVLFVYYDVHGDDLAGGWKDGA